MYDIFSIYTYSIYTCSIYTFTYTIVLYKVLIHMYVVVYRGVKSAGLGIATPRFWTGGSWGSQGVVGSWNIVISYHVGLQEVCSKVVTLKRNRIICPEAAVNEKFLPGKSIFFKLPEKSKFFKNLPEKVEIFQNLPGKIDIFLKFAWNIEYF